MDHGDRAGIVQVGMRIFLRRRSVGGPACMGDAQAALFNGRLRQFGIHFVGQALDFSLVFEKFKMIVAEKGQAGRIVAAVLEPFQTAE